MVYDRSANHTCYIIRDTSIRYGFLRFLSDTGLHHFDTDLARLIKTIFLTIWCPCMRYKTIRCNGIIVYC